MSDDTRYFGLCMSPKGVRSFVVRDRAKVPKDAMGDVHSTEAGGERAVELSKKLLEEYWAPRDAEPTDDAGDELVPGGVCLYDDDGSREHCAILLKPDGDRWFAVFFTSSTHWTSAPCLRATPEDLAYSGFVNRSTTYLAPVVRPTAFFRSLRRSIPADRVSQIIRFFEKHFKVPA